MSFDWQTEEDSEWDEQDWQEQLDTAESPKRPWRTILLILVLVSAVGLLIYRQVNSRLVETAAAVETDIFATHNLLSRAASNRDGDLGKAVLSGRDPGWSQTQADLLIAGLYFENPTLGFTLADEAAAYAPLFREDDRFVDLQLDPDLNGAELNYLQEYVAFTEDGVQQVTLEQTAVYRRGETRWLLSPPLEPFWGGWETEEIDNVTYIFPARDAELISRLTPELSALLAETCETLPEMDCSPAVQIRFDTDPESLLDIADPANLYESNLRLNLPTPTLVGVPIDNDGYEALTYAYGTKLVAALLAHTSDYSCCAHAPMFQSLIVYQLSELGLAEWPVTQQTQQDLANTGVHTELLFPYWASTDFSLISSESSWQLYGFIDFLLKRYVPQMSTLSLLTQMNSTQIYQSWLVGLRNENEYSPFGANQISRDWWFYTLTQAEVAAVSQHPVSLPAQDLQVGCMKNESATALFRYELGSDIWREEFSYEGVGFFNPLPRDNGVVLQLLPLSEEQIWQTLLWQEGRSVDVMNLDDVYSISLGQMDPNGRFLLSYFGTEAQESLPEPLLIDMESCVSGSCESAPINRTPHWSPDSRWMLLTDSNLFESSQYVVDGRIISLSPGNLNHTHTIWLRQAEADPETAVAVGEGSAPFWLDNERFGYIHTMPDTTQPVSQQLLVATLDNPEPEAVLTTAAIHNALPDRSQGNVLLMQYAIAHPAENDLLIVLATTQSYNGHLFQLNLASKELTLLFPINLSRGEHSLGFSPDGRFLVTTSTVQSEATSLPGEANLFGGLYIYDFQEQKQQTILVNNDLFFPAFTFDWSADGNWLAFIRDRSVIGLLAPAYDYQDMIVHEVANCTSLAWVNHVDD